jgi:hypothetical protein
MDLLPLLQSLQLARKFSQLTEGKLAQHVFLAIGLALEEGQEELWYFFLDDVVAGEGGLMEGIGLVLPHNININGERI